MRTGQVLHGRLVGAGIDKEGAEPEERTGPEAGGELSVEAMGAACSVAGSFLCISFSRPQQKSVLCLSWSNLRFRFAAKDKSELSALI